MLMSEKPSFYKPDITRDSDGIAHLDGTRLPVWMVVNRAKIVGDFNRAREEFVDGYPWLTEAHFDSAIFYYKVNQEEIERDIEKKEQLLRLLQEHSDPTTGIVDVDALEKALAP